MVSVVLLRFAPGSVRIVLGALGRIEIQSGGVQIGLLGFPCLQTVTRYARAPSLPFPACHFPNVDPTERPELRINPLG